MKILEDLLVETITKSELINRILHTLKDLNLPFEYYVGAGCITNTVWNDISDYPLEYGISDVDIVYYDPLNITPEGEKKFRDAVLNLLGDFEFKVDIKNQARVHLWYEDKFGFSIKPYHSLESSIDSWPTTATALGLRLEPDGSYKIYAPYGLDDLFSIVVRPNKLMITREIFENKANKWRKKWPKLLVVSW
ncbi:nucleotidyltransferase family protein [Metabacillus idriensis]|uniref:nucleotidyltransferase family protein n=1 Tax=Metabacillus idriensis TaxID=324768 RepID=UPI0028132357|nr:nucleotidyltransferase family protein [Metabacillus idriensis]MDR0137882.1 nucleotidyltransferase family protein [Metabacillus idriensis]